MGWYAIMKKTFLKKVKEKVKSKRKKKQTKKKSVYFYIFFYSKSLDFEVELNSLSFGTMNKCLEVCV
jgi:hypothetical protein